MYSTCIFCKNSLGANEAIEQFPIGRRLAFDAAKGRLWVVCRKCERWNLSPLETRWEAIEECERSFRGTKLRTSTDQIGLARLSEGLELVRIGKPLRPEFAAWRYGDQFGNRRKRNLMSIGAGLAAGAAIPLIGPVLGVSAGALGMSLLQATNLGTLVYNRTKIVARVPGADGNLRLIRRIDVDKTVMLPPTGPHLRPGDIQEPMPWGLRIQHRQVTQVDAKWWRYEREAETTEIRGDDAIRVAAQLLPQLNSKGASARVVREAVALATSEDSPMLAFGEAAQVSAATPFEMTAEAAASKRSINDFGKGGLLSRVPKEVRLALEMISHEDSERRALEGELRVLEEAWRDAEEIAGISDDLLLPSEISTRLSDMKRDRT